MLGASRIAIPALLLLLGLTGCGKSEEKVDHKRHNRHKRVHVEAGSAVPAEHFTLGLTSWGAAKDSAKATPKAPPIPVTWEEGQRQKFEREAAKRWKNTEIFIRRDR